MFKDLYTKDVGRETLSNLMKTNKGRSSYHERYVKELEEVTLTRGLEQGRSLGGNIQGDSGVHPEIFCIVISYE